MSGASGPRRLVAPVLAIAIGVVLLAGLFHVRRVDICSVRAQRADVLQGAVPQ